MLSMMLALSASGLPITFRGWRSAGHPSSVCLACWSWL